MEVMVCSAVRLILPFSAVRLLPCTDRILVVPLTHRREAARPTAAQPTLAPLVTGLALTVKSALTVVFLPLVMDAPLPIRTPVIPVTST